VLWAAGLEPTIAAALPRAQAALASGAAWRKLEALRTALSSPATAAGGG
jgi:anthranilate phosphoribosyltransferase